jgi:hypothetical protein
MRAATVARPRAVSIVCVGIAVVVGGLVGSSSWSMAAESAAGAAVAYEQPKVVPAEFNGDVRSLPIAPLGASRPRSYRPLLRGPRPTKVSAAAIQLPSAPEPPGGPRAPMPSPIQNFAGISKTDTCSGVACGSGWPPDTNGDVGPNHYILAVNSAIGIYSKTGTLLASFTEDNLWLGAGSSPCNGNSQGDPVVLYDWLADRFVLTWFAFNVDGNGDPITPFFQCIAASKTGDPVAGGYWLYAIRMDPGGTNLPPVGDLNDYAKFGLWHDCLYMGTNEFSAAPNFNYDGVAFGSFSRIDMYNGLPLTYALGYLGPASNAFTMVPSHNQAKGANAPQAGTPNYFVSESGSLFTFEVRKFTAGVNCGAGGTLSALTNVTQASYSFLNLGDEVPQPNTAAKLDNIGDRIMQKVQYRKIGGTESLWVTHNVDTGAGPTAMQWAQINVTGGTIVTTPVQQQIYAPDATLWRWMGSLAVDNQGNMALGYSTSNGTAPNFPSIAYSGRLATDPLNTLPQTEVQLIAGNGSQVNPCGPFVNCPRWGDYTAMSLDPSDECTFWYTNEYYDTQANGNTGNWHTRIGSFKFPSCSPPPASSLLVYKSLEPCRIMDTRNATLASGVQGPITGGSLKLLPGFIAAGSTWGAYGQPAPVSDCGLRNPPGYSIKAVAIVITILIPNFDAFLGVSDIGNLAATLSTVALNYTHGQGLSTMYIVPQVASNTIYFALPAALSAHLIFDVVGYFVVSDATALQCTTQSSAPATIAAASTGSATSPACGAGYVLTSGSCDSTSFSMKLVADKASGQTWVCSASNLGGSSANLTATANCCRVPGK